MKELETRYQIATERYIELKLRCEDLVVKWEYATGPFYEANPLYFQMHEIPKGRLLKGEIGNRNYTYQYGFDIEDKLVVSRQFVHSLLPKVCVYEEFFINENDCTFGYLFDYSNEKRIINVTRAKYENSRIVAYKKFAARGWSSEIFLYNNDLLERIDQTYYNFDYSKNIENRSYHVFYDEENMLKTIQLIVPQNDNFKDGYSRIIYQRSYKYKR